MQNMTNLRIKIILVAVIGVAAFKCIIPLFSKDTIFLNGSILTMVENHLYVAAVLIKDGKIESIGTEAEILEFDNWQTNIVDLNGQTMMPGLIEAHCHPIATAILNQVLDISGFNYNSRAEIIDLIKLEVEMTTGEWE